MTKEDNQNQLKQIIDNLLLINLFTVIFFAIFFIFAIIMVLSNRHEEDLLMKMPKKDLVKTKLVLRWLMI